jgi:hypothetical protein
LEGGSDEREFLLAMSERVPETGRSPEFARWFVWATEYAEKHDPLGEPERVAQSLEPDPSEAGASALGGDWFRSETLRTLRQGRLRPGMQVREIVMGLALGCSYCI